MTKFERAAIFAAATLLVGAMAAPAIARDPSFLEIESVAPALFEPQSDVENFILDPQVLRELGDIDSSSLRLLREDSKASYWIAQDSPSGVCLVVQTANATSSSCTEIARFHRTGIGIATGESYDKPETIVEVYLLPGDINGDKIIAGANSSGKKSPHLLGYSQRNLLSIEPEYSSYLTSQRVKREGQSDFIFTPLEYGPLDGGDK